MSHLGGNDLATTYQIWLSYISIHAKKKKNQNKEMDIQRLGLANNIMKRKKTAYSRNKFQHQTNHKQTSQQ